MSQRVDKDSLQLDKPRRTPGHPTKSHIVKTKVDGKEKIIRFGEQGASTAGKPKAGESERMTKKRASFKARHAKNIAKGKSSPAYWADKVKWNTGGSVELKNMLNDYEAADDVTHLVQKFKNGGQPKKAKKDVEPGIMDYLESAYNTASSLPDLPNAIYQSGKRVVQAIPANVRSGLNYIQRSTPQQVVRDARQAAQQTASSVKGGLNRIVEHVKENPFETIVDVIPVVGDIKAYGEDVGRAARLRAQGDERGAANIEQYALPLAVASVIPGIGEARTANRIVNAADDLSDVEQLTRRLNTQAKGDYRNLIDMADEPTATKVKLNDLVSIQDKKTGDTVNRYVDDIAQGNPVPPVTVTMVDGKPVLLNGNHRVAAATQSGLDEIDANVYPFKGESGPTDDIKQLTRKLITKPERGPVLPGPGETDILYRGAAPSEGRPQFIPDRQRQGVTWFSSDPKVASEYAYTTNYDPDLDGPTVTPVRLKPSNMMDVDAQGNTYTTIPLPDEYYGTRDIDDYAYDPAEMYGEDTGGTLMTSTDKLAQLATDLDHDAVRMRNIIDFGPGADEAGRSRVADTYAAFDPSIVIPMAGRMNERKTNLDRFLKESIMKDEAGDPVVLFHGTSDDVTGNFNIYHPNRKDQGWLGRGAYVTDAPEMASEYARRKVGRAGANVMPLYGDIRNPYNMTLKEKNQLRFLSQDAIDDFTSKLRDAGHDSAIVTYPDGVREIAVFDPERQLKSASGNRGTYDPDNPDLKFAQGGLVSSYDEAIVKDLADKIREGIYG
jgi:hypothetical protein